MEDFFAAADVFVLPAHYEEFGLTVLEALASGCPAVVGARCGASEVLNPGLDGYVLEDLQDPEECVDQISRALSLRQNNNACRRTAELYSWERHAAAMAEIYRELG